MAKKNQVEEESPEDYTVEIPDRLMVLASNEMVAFPSVVMSVYLTRASNIDAINECYENYGGVFFAVAQRDLETEEPKKKDLYTVGVAAQLSKVIELSDGRVRIIFQGLIRARAKKYEKEDGLFVTDIEPLPLEEVETTAKHETLLNRIKENIQVLVEYEYLPEDILLVGEEDAEIGVYVDTILAHYQFDIPTAQEALEELDSTARLELADSLITDDLTQVLVSEEIKDRARDELSKGQKEYFLREQIKLLHQELGDTENSEEELVELIEALDKAKLPKDAREEADKQLKRLKRMHQENSEWSLLRTYLEWIADLPWAKKSRDRLDIPKAKEVLDQEHHGLEKVKDRILEYLSVRKLRKSNSRGEILCLVGPPGVGKTSLGKSIASALGRKFVRISLGGMRDEAEIRGHRRTYVGALPGRIIQGLKQAGTRNPVIVLDELDKIGSDFRGDPAAALLEVLDPAQNKHFRDYYLNIDFDLSDVMFVATANTLDTIPDALLDRLEVLRIPGYTRKEKQRIAQKHLIPKVLSDLGLEDRKLTFDAQGLEILIENYTREAGVRNLEREIASLYRKIARKIAEGEKSIPKKVTEQLVRDLLGPSKYTPEDDERKDLVGFVRGLAWTIYGGEMLAIEASIAPGTGSLYLTGQLGDVMQESAKAALFYARANSANLGLEPDFHKARDIHIHVPAGATPKDGPSAGVTIATALVSALSNRRVSKDIAMTGEITLRGRVLPVGGIKEKALAALRYGITKVIIPFENIRDLEEIPKEQREAIKFIPVKHIAEVLEISFVDSARKSKVRKGSSKKKTRKSVTVK